MTGFYRAIKVTRPSVTTGGIAFSSLSVSVSHRIGRGGIAEIWICKQVPGLPSLLAPTA